MHHTSEPWDAKTGDRAAIEIVDQRGNIVAICPAGYGASERTANAKRIVACVNACAGINPDHLQEFVAAMKAYRNAKTIGESEFVRLGLAMERLTSTPQ